MRPCLEGRGRTFLLDYSYAGQSPEVKQQIIELFNTGSKEQAVIYLDAMNQRIAGKVLAEFKTDDEVKLAKELLERVRTLGRPDGQASDPTDSSDANGTANTR